LLNWMLERRLVDWRRFFFLISSIQHPASILWELMIWEKTAIHE
jgi:hypothetical protein